MREIKFRSWLKDEKSMNYNFTILNHPQMSEDEEHILMQYAGLKDKNGREIYEGDIIVNGSIPGPGYGISGLMLTKYEVKMVNGCFVVECIPDCVDDHVFGNCHLLYDMGFETRNIVEVIGNIYENPELLE